MAKKPKIEAPKVGDHVKLKGRDAHGNLYQVNVNEWCLVAWTPHRSGPKIVHLRELEKVEQ